MGGIFGGHGRLQSRNDVCRQSSGIIRFWHAAMPHPEPDAPSAIIMDAQQRDCRAMLFERPFTRIANHVAYATGTPGAFIICCLVIVVWVVTGPLFGFSDTWQLIINTGTTIVTFLMVFLIQNTQNRDGVAIQAKLDELIRVGNGRNQFVGIEHLTETEVEAFRKKCERAAKEHDRKQRAKVATG
jgi:low affinity Fe/Cu permease